MYIGHLFGPLHCKFATFTSNDSARSMIFCWLALCGMREMQACGLYGGWVLPDFWCGRMDAGRPRVVWATEPDGKMHCGAMPDAARCVGRCSALRGAVHRAAGWRPLTCGPGDDSPVWRRDGAWAGFTVLWKGCAEGALGAFVPLCPAGSGQAVEPAHSPLCQGRKAKAGTAGVLSPPWYMVVWDEACAPELIRLQA